ncbi:MAG TPA: hypothetical protein VGH76_03905 [Actinomycetospora sp.]|jgi:hypothetical protein|uniref:hypothetical protein n=1 Tax=Actinomycetospora sp. TaxID=1872135 RepID=UPI002F42D682
MTGTTTTAPQRTTAGTATLHTLQVLGVLSVLSLVCQAVTAGQLFPRGGPVELHADGAVVFHVLTGLTAVAAGLHRRATRGPRWPTVLAALVFVLSFVQAWFGDRGTLFVHVPGAIVLTIGTVWVAAWTFTSGACRPGHP